MFDSLLQNLVGGAPGIQERADGVAFLKVAMTLHSLATISYLSFNIPMSGTRRRYVQCTYSDSWVKQCVSLQPIPDDRLSDLVAALSGHMDRTRLPEESATKLMQRPSVSTSVGRRLLSFPLRALAGETAILCVGAEPSADWAAQRNALARELPVLGNYFHQHILRIHGHDSETAMLISARELDCLKWMAAGKTAWEASVILGISERTVRFHLNAAREKLDCLTTTQAVAKAVAQQLI